MFSKNVVARNGRVGARALGLLPTYIPQTRTFAVNLSTHAADGKSKLIFLFTKFNFNPKNEEKYK